MLLKSHSPQFQYLAFIISCYSYSFQIVLYVCVYVLYICGLDVICLPHCLFVVKVAIHQASFGSSLYICFYSRNPKEIIQLKGE